MYMALQDFVLLQFPNQHIRPCPCFAVLYPSRQVVSNCTLALKIDAESSKALYRRAYARFAKKDYDGAKVDLDQAQKAAPGDKAVVTLLKKVGTTWTFRRTVFSALTRVFRSFVAFFALLCRLCMCKNRR